MNTLFRTTVADVVAATGGKLLFGDGATAISSITSDSRETGPDALFVPIAGEKFDGHAYIADLCAEKKIKAFLTMRAPDAAAAASHGVAAILCDDTLRALALISKAHRRSFAGTLVGITGTNGKTTTKELLATILSLKHSVIKSEKNYNNEIGVPFMLMKLDRQEYAVIEMGMNHAGEISRLTDISRPGDRDHHQRGRGAS